MEADASAVSRSADDDISVEGINTGISNEADNSEVCRVCHCEASECRPLFHPCKCAGSIKYVHQDCLLQWLHVAGNNNSCEICGEKITFSKIYGKSAFSPLLVLCGILLQNMQSSLYSFLHRAIPFIECIIVLISLSLWGLLCIKMMADPGQIYRPIGYSTHVQLALQPHNLLPGLALMMLNGLLYLLILLLLRLMYRERPAPPPEEADPVVPAPMFLLTTRNLTSLGIFAASHTAFIPLSVILGRSTAEYLASTMITSLTSSVVVDLLLPASLMHLSDCLAKALVGSFLMVAALSLTIVLSSLRVLWSHVLFVTLICISIPVIIGASIDVAIWKPTNTTFAQRCTYCMETNEKLSDCVLSVWFVGFVPMIKLMDNLRGIKALLKPNTLPHSIYDGLDDNYFNTVNTFEIFVTYVCIGLVAVLVGFLLPLHITYLFFPHYINSVLHKLFDRIIWDMSIFLGLFPQQLMTWNSKMGIPYYTEVFVLRLCEWLCIDEYLIADNLFAMMLLIRHVNKAAAVLRLNSNRAFQAHSLRLAHMCALKESLAAAQTLHSQFKAEIFNDDLSADINQQQLLSMCFAHIIAIKISELNLRLNELDELSTHDILLLRQFQDSLTVMKNTVGMHLYLNQTASSCLGLLEEDICANRDNIALLNKTKASSNASTDIATTPTTICSEKLLNSLFVKFLHGHGKSVSSISESLVDSNVDEGHSEAEEACYARSIGDEMSKNNDQGVDEEEADKSEETGRYEISRIISILMSHSKADKTIDGNSYSNQKTISLLANVESALLAKLDETSREVDSTNTSGFSWNMHIIPIEFRCIMHICICCFSLMSLSMFLINVPLPIGRHLSKHIGFQGILISFDMILGIGVCYVLAMIVSSCGKNSLIDELIVISKRLFSCIIFILKFLLRSLGLHFFVPFLMHLLTDITFSPLLNSIGITETSILSDKNFLLSLIGFLGLYLSKDLIGFILGDPQWGRNFDKALDVVTHGVNLKFVFGEVINPAALLFIDLLLFPYALGKIASLTVENYQTKSLILRYSFISFITFSIFCFGLGFIWRKLKIAFEEVKDSRYLLSIRLSNRLEGQH